MIIKKFVANTEQEAVMMAKEEMGSNAVVLNIKTTKQRGFKRLFKKDTVEITAALEDKTTSSIPVSRINIAVDDNIKKEERKPTAIEEKLDNLQSILESRMANPEEKELDNVKTEKNANITFIQLIYNQLLENEVDEKYINQIISEIESSLKKESNLDTILASVYQKIVLKIGSPVEISLEDKKTKIAFFVGPMFKLDKEAKVAMITSDTYRIAAVEQLRTYANILDVPLQVVYTIEELNDAIDKFKEYDLILVDTAGRSHKNKEQCMEMLHFANDCVIPEDCTKEVFIVLSASTKYKDLENIVDVYSEIGNYNIIFTKLDETTSFGNILNIRLYSGADLSYMTNGQSVPDDLEVFNTQMVVKQLLGGK